MRWIKMLVALSSVCAWIASCVPSDSERCPENFVWDKQVKMCYCAEGMVFDPVFDDCVPIETGTGGTDTSEDTESDGGMDGGSDGFFSPCEAEQDCAEFEQATYCVVNPETGQGSCTMDCSSEQCPDSLLCCDCSSVPVIGWQLCLPSSSAPALELWGCSCT